MNACILGWGQHPTQQRCLPTLSSLATATCTPHWLLFQTRGPVHWGSSSHLILSAFMTWAEVRLLVTDTTLCAAMTFFRVLHCIHLETQNASLCWRPVWMAQALLLASAPASRWYDRQGELFIFRRTCASCSFLLTYKNSHKPGEQCREAALVLHLSIPAGFHTKQPGCSET